MWLSGRMYALNHSNAQQTGVIKPGTASTDSSAAPMEASRNSLVTSQGPPPGGLTTMARRTALQGRQGRRHHPAEVRPQRQTKITHDHQLTVLGLSPGLLTGPMENSPPPPPGKGGGPTLTPKSNRHYPHSTKQTAADNVVVLHRITWNPLWQKTFRRSLVAINIFKAYTATTASKLFTIKK